MDFIFIAEVGAIHFQLKIGASSVLESTIAVNNKNTSFPAVCQA